MFHILSFPYGLSNLSNFGGFLDLNWIWMWIVVFSSRWIQRFFGIVGCEVLALAEMIGFNCAYIVIVICIQVDYVNKWISIALNGNLTFFSGLISCTLNATYAVLVWCRSIYDTRRILRLRSEILIAYLYSIIHANVLLLLRSADTVPVI